MKGKKDAFTLIELAVVLVIAGLIVAGIAAGFSIVQNAKMRNVIADLQKYQTAINVFRTTYDQLPGDSSNATDYWSTTTSGNDDGWIGYDYFGGSPPSGSAAENIRMWQHLSLAGIIPGSYTGTGSNHTDLQIGVNAPATAVDNGGFFMMNWGTADSGRIGNAIGVGGGDSGCATNIFTPAESQQADIKIDDGAPRTAKLWICGSSSAAGCFTTAGEVSTYNTNNKSKLCAWHWITRFR